MAGRVDHGERHAFVEHEAFAAFQQHLGREARVPASGVVGDAACTVARPL